MAQLAESTARNSAGPQTELELAISRLNDALAVIDLINIPLAAAYVDLGKFYCEQARRQ